MSLFHMLARGILLGILSVLCWIMGYQAWAQADSTIVRFYIPSQFFIIKTGDNIFENRKIIKLPQGLQRIQIYTPEYEFLDTLIFVEENPEGQIITPVFKISKEFDRYIGEMKAYREKNFVDVGIPLIVTAISAGFTVYYYGRANLSFDNAAYTYRKWLGANTFEKQTYFDEFQRHFDDYKYYRTLNYISLAVASVSSVFTVKGIIKYYKRKTPTYKLPIIPFKEYDLKLEPLSYDLLYPGIKIIVPF